MGKTPETLDNRPAGGRPRDGRIDAAVLAAVRDLLVEEGYARLSFETVARRAGVTRPTIYRRWPSKAHLVHAAVYPMEERDVLIPDTGDFAADVRVMVADTVASYARPEARAALPGLFTDLHPDPALRAEVIDGLESSARRQFRALVAGARERGEVRAGFDADVVFDMLSGAVLAHVLSGRAMPRGIVDDLTDVVLRGMRAA